MPYNMHSLTNGIHFFRIISGTSVANGILKLPRNFSTRCGDGMSNPVFLKPPDSTEWKIYWTKRDGEMWFQKGWKEFSTCYSLDHGHLLLFEYVGISHFHVHIFDHSALEIDYPSHFTHGNPKITDACRDGKDILVQTSDDFVESLNEQAHDGMDNIVQINDDSREILDEQCNRKAEVKHTASSPQLCKKMKNSITPNAGGNLNGINLHQHDQTKSTSLQVKQELDEEKGKIIVHTECPRVEQLTSTVLQRATTFKSIHPFFMLIMKPSLINGDYLDIPPQFSEKYLKKNHAVILLEVMDGRSWPVIFSASRITNGWQKFASENHLNEEDVCVFELILKIQGHAFRVYFFRSAGEPSGPISHDHPKCSKMLLSTNWTGESSSERTSHVESHLKLKFLVEENRKEASKFTSEKPFFMATLKLQGNTTRCPRVPSNFVKKYFAERNQHVMKIQFRKRVWGVTFVLNEYDISGIFSAGWPLFSRENKLEGGDVCVFELINREDVTLDVHVFRGHTEVMH